MCTTSSSRHRANEDSRQPEPRPPQAAIGRRLGKAGGFPGVQLAVRSVNQRLLRVVFARARERERGAGGWWEALEFASEKRLVGGREEARGRDSWWEGAGARSHIHVHAEPAREGKGKKKGGGSGGSRRLLKWPEAHMVLPVPGEWKASSSAAIPLPFLLLRQLLLLLLVLTAPLLMD